MLTQSEAQLEQALIAQLIDMGYEYVPIENEADMKANLKRQLEKHNRITLTPTESEQVLNRLNKGTVFERAHILRDDPFPLKRDTGDIWIRFFDSDEWCMNEFQVTHQVTMEGKRKNRYDVTILINGLPLVQIELKKRGTELKKAFHQNHRYHHESYLAGSGLFQYIQIFIISNGVNTKYFANHRTQSFEHTFVWTDKNNHSVSDLSAFTAQFLKPCHIAKMIAHYTVLHETAKMLMVMRPYQVYAAEALVHQVKHTSQHAYIWHTTGSGKTLTSFKTSQMVMRLPTVHKVLFVVDRKDLDYQTAREFNAFSPGCVDHTTHTEHLVSQLQDNSCKLIVTTLQKLHRAIVIGRHVEKLAPLRDKKCVFIFDECHRSQFGDTHRNIKKFFTYAQMFGFTGTPILAENAVGTVGHLHTTHTLFGECLHKYVIVDAIRDENVLRFSVEYVGHYQRKNSANELDIEVEAIDKKELIESESRLSKIVDYILHHHHHKTKYPHFTALFCVSSVDMLIRYYELFKQKQRGKERLLKIATIFSYTTNEEDPYANGFIDGLLPEETIDIGSSEKIDRSKRDALDTFIADYNALFHTQYSSDSQSFYHYYQDIAKRVRAGEVDILLVVNMFLTGFDSPRLNTLYVDKNLRFHGLIQAFSRTNRILNEKKSQGNIVCFRNLKRATDEAIALFSNPEAQETVLVKPYEEYIEDFKQGVEKLLRTAPTVQSVDRLPSEKEQVAFVTHFRNLLRIKNVLTTFADYSPTDLNVLEQTFEDYKSKYLDLYETVQRQSNKEKVSVLEEVDFELSLMHRDEINVAYILHLLVHLTHSPPEERQQRQKQIMEILAGEVQLRSKRSLIEQFIDDNVPYLDPSKNVTESFETFWNEQQRQALETLSREENVSCEKLQKLVNNYHFTNELPKESEVCDALQYKPKILERKRILERVTHKIRVFIDTFIEGMGGSV